MPATETETRPTGVSTQKLEALFRASDEDERHKIIRAVDVKKIYVNARKI